MSECRNPSPHDDSPLSRAHRYAYDNYVPMFVTFELTLGCNLKCVHCYNFDRSSGPVPERLKQNALSPEEIKRVIGEVADAGAIVLSLTGGEALAHPHLLDFVRHARTCHLYVRLKSNGMLLTPERVRALVEAGVADTEISLYGADAPTHDAFTGVAGSFQRTVAGISAARDGGLPPKLSFILHRGNYQQLDALMALADDLRVPYDFSIELTKRYDGTEDSQCHQITPAQFEELLTGPHGAIFDAHHSGTSVQCPCARSVCGITSTGEVYPCIGAPVPSGNLRERSFTDIWKNSPQLNRIRGLKLEDFEDCAPCPDRGRCTRSSGTVYTNTGNYTGSEEFTCAQTKLRARHSELSR